jgi:hypothetical protein
MNAHPFHLVLGHYLVKLLFDEGNVLVDLFRSPTEAGVTSRYAAIDRRADPEVILEGLLKGCRRFGRSGG